MTLEEKLSKFLPNHMDYRGEDKSVLLDPDFFFLLVVVNL